MGIKLFSSGTSYNSCITPTSVTSPNPNPYRFEVIKRRDNSKYILLILKYQDCTTYNGYKVLLYKIEDKNEVDRMIRDKNLDPHFLEGNTSPILRVPYSIEGLELISNIMKGLI